MRQQHLLALNKNLYIDGCCLQNAIVIWMTLSQSRGHPLAHIAVFIQCYLTTSSSNTAAS